MYEARKKEKVAEAIIILLHNGKYNGSDDVMVAEYDGYRSLGS